MLLIPKEKAPKTYQVNYSKPRQVVERKEVISLSKSAEAELMRFLDKADDAYIRAYQFKFLGDLVRYALPEVCAKVQHNIMYRQNKLFGNEKYRIREWTMMQCNERFILVRKELNFKTIKFGHTRVPMGDHCVEYWRILLDSSNKYVIGEIQENV
jgi:hypothetical protein